MKRYFPSIKGWVALASVVLADLLAPSIFPAMASGKFVSPVPITSWVIGAGMVVLCLLAGGFAALRGGTPDRIAAFIAALLVLWLAGVSIYAAA